MTIRAFRLGWQLLVMAAGLGAGAAQAVPITYGTGEYVTIRTCFPGLTLCDSISPIVQGEFGGAPGASSSSATTSLAGYGTADGSVALSGTIGAPVLRASATSTSTARTNTNSVALQQYTYTGATATTRTFGGALTYSQVATGPYASGIGDGVYAAIDIFTLSSSTIEAGATPESNFFALFNAPFGGLPGYASLGSDFYTDATSTAVGLGSLGVTVALNPGDTIWVWVLLQTPAAAGASIDASNTLITAWDNAADLVPAVVAQVPEPGTLALLASSLGLLALRVRRQGVRPARALEPA